jgi:hypothetical protein
MELSNNIRQNNINIFEEIFNSKKIADAIEKSIYNFTLEYIQTNNVPFLSEQIYNDKFNELSSFLKKNKNDEHIINILKTKANNIAYLKEDELCPKKYDEIIKKNTQREVRMLRLLRHPNIVELKEAFKRK